MCYCVWIVGDIDGIAEVRVTCYSVWIVADRVGIVVVRVSVLLCLDRG